MANKNFVVHNGLEVGTITMFAGNGDIVTTGNLSSTNPNSISTMYVRRFGLQVQPALASPTWYKLGILSASAGAGAGENVEIGVYGGVGYSNEADARDIINVRILNGTGPNVQANFYSNGFRQAVQQVKLKSLNSSSTDTQWEIYALLSPDIGNGFVEVKLSNSAIFTWINTADTDPGAASATLVVATSKFVTATSNVVVASGNLYVGGNIFQNGSLVSTTSASGIITNTIIGNGTTGPFSLTNTPADKDQISVWWNGIYQPKNTYNLSVNQLSFTEAVPSGSVVEVKILAGAGISLLGTLADIDFTNTPTNGQYLSYNSSTQKWVPSTGLDAAVIQNQAITYAVALGGF